MRYFLGCHCWVLAAIGLLAACAPLPADPLTPTALPQNTAESPVATGSPVIAFLPLTVTSSEVTVSAAPQMTTGPTITATPTWTPTATATATITPTSVPPTATPFAGSEGAGTISGTVWLDYCGVLAGSTPPERGICIGSLADGVRQEAEAAVPDLVVTLHPIDCTRPLFKQVTTGPDGRYTFSGIGAGPYCVQVSLETPPNNALIPGRWTFPAGFAGKLSASYMQPLKNGQQVDGLDFAFDPQTDN